MIFLLTTRDISVIILYANEKIKKTKRRRKIMYQVIKRDGKVSGFDIIKIADAIKKAFEACEKQYNDNII